MNKSKVYDMLIMLLAAIGVVYQIDKGNLLEALGIVTLTAMTLRLMITRYLAVLMFGLYVITSILSGSMSILSILIFGLITQKTYLEWNSSGKTVSLIHLDATSSIIFTRFLLFMVILNGLMVFIFSGFNLMAMFSFPIMYSILSSSLEFLAIYMIAMRIYEASYFYVGVLLLNMVMMIMISVSGIMGIAGLVDIKFLIYQLIFVSIFIIRNR